MIVKISLFLISLVIIAYTVIERLEQGSAGAALALLCIPAVLYVYFFIINSFTYFSYHKEKRISKLRRGNSYE